MTLSPTERKIVVGLELEKANSIFSQIEVLQNAGFWDNIANRLYYSLFHAVSALLINEGLPVNSHKGLALVGSIGDVFLCQFLYGSENRVGTACAKCRMKREVVHQMSGDILYA